jgi:hypothetical protein
MKEELQSIVQSIREYFPDMAEDSETIQYEWIQRLEKLIGELK